MAGLFDPGNRALVKLSCIWAMLARIRVNVTIFQETGLPVIAAQKAMPQGIAPRLVASTPITIPPNALKVGLA